MKHLNTRNLDQFVWTATVAEEWLFRLVLVLVLMLVLAVMHNITYTTFLSLSVLHVFLSILSFLFGFIIH